MEREVSKQLRIFRMFYNLLTNLNITRRPIREDIKAPTLFDTIPNAIHLHIPIYFEYIPALSDETSMQLKTNLTGRFLS